MRSIRFAIHFFSLGLLAAAAAGQQGLVCPGTTAGRPCDAFHYHVGMYRPDTKQFVEAFGVNQFATQAACDRAREQQMAANTRVVTFFRTVREQQYEADRFGACHCDMTIDRSSANFLTDAQRAQQLRTVEEIRLRVREKLLDNKLLSDAEAVRGLWSEPPVTPLLGGNRLVSPPNGVAAPAVTLVDDLKATKSIDNSKPAVVALDLPLQEVGAAPVMDPGTPDPGVATPVATVPAPPSSETAPQETIETVDVAPPPPVEEQGERQGEQVVHAEGAPSEQEVQSAQETAESFVTYETQRIQNVLRASAAIGDETVKSKIFETAMQRIQLLSNLRLLIEGSGMRSRLAEAARQAESEEARLELMSRLFGDDVAPHWAPKDAADVVFEIDSEIASAPERVLRDTTGQFSVAQKKRALYLVLAQTQPTEDQRLWLSAVVEGFLK
jgi:hypothetical protein